MLGSLRAATFVICCAGLSVAGLAHAQERHARTFVTWDVALEELGCRARETTLAEVERRLGRRLGASSEAESDLTLSVTLDRSGARGAAVVLVLARTGAEVLGTRRIDTEDPRCRTLDEALPLVIAMLVDLHEQDARLVLPPVPEPTIPPPSVPSSPPTPALAPAPIASAPAVPAPAHAAGAALVGGLEIGASLDLGLLPDPVIAPEILGGIGAEADVFAGMFRASLVTPDASGQLLVYGARVAAGSCAYGRIAPLALGGCALLEAGWIHAEGRGFDVARTADTPALAVDALLEAVLLALAPFTVRLEVGASVPLVVQRFVYDTSGDESILFRSSPVTLRGGVFVGLTSE